LITPANQEEEGGEEKYEDLLGLVEGEEEEEEKDEDTDSIEDEEDDIADTEESGLVYSDLLDGWVDAKAEKEIREKALQECKDTMRREKRWRKLISNINIKSIIFREIRKLSRDTYWGKEGVAETAIDSMTSYLSGNGLGPDHPISWGTTAYEFWDNVRSARLNFLY
jgi:hypothetical protein